SVSRPSRSQKSWSKWQDLNLPTPSSRTRERGGPVEVKSLFRSPGASFAPPIVPPGIFPRDFPTPKMGKKIWRYFIHVRYLVMLLSLMPDQKPASNQCNGLDHCVADHGDLEDASEYARGVGKARGRHHRTAEAVSAHQHFGDHRNDQRKRQRHLHSGHDLRQPCS